MYGYPLNVGNFSVEFTSELGDVPPLRVDATRYSGTVKVERGGVGLEGGRRLLAPGDLRQATGDGVARPIPARTRTTRSPREDAG